MNPIIGFRDGDVALVTGAAGGIGRALTKLLASCGVTVVAADLPDAIDRVETATLCVSFDIRDEQDVADALRRIEREVGPIHMLANNASIVGHAVEAPLLEHSIDLFRRVVDVNLTGQFIVLKAVAGQMVDHEIEGRIVNVASLRGHLGGERIAAYVAAKAGVIGLTRATALELAPHKIRVNAVAPGFIATAKALEEEAASTPWRFTKPIPLQRYGEPPEAATLIATLLSENTGYVTGSIFDIDGGMRAY